MDFYDNLRYLVKVGDELILMQEMRSKAHIAYPVPNVTRATIQSFDKIFVGEFEGSPNPGVYLDPFRAVVKFEYGSEMEGADPADFVPVDRDEFERRNHDFQQFLENNPEDGLERWREHHFFVGPLPDTYFRVGDTVTLKKLFQDDGTPLFSRQDGDFEDQRRYRTSTFVVEHIDYCELLANEHSQYAVKLCGEYDLDYIKRQTPGITASALDMLKAKGWHLITALDNLLLIERGNPWRYYENNGPLIFKNLGEEAMFTYRIGQARKVCNPATGDSAWCLEEALAAVRAGEAHGILTAAGHEPEQNEPVELVRFNNPELGERVAAATLSNKLFIHA